MLLFISQWFPSDENNIYAPFIQEHLNALSGSDYVVAITGNLTFETVVAEEWAEKCVNYRVPLSPNDNFIYNIVKFNFYCLYLLLFKCNTKFETVFVNVFTSIFVAYFCKIRYRTRLVFIEHWSFWVRKRVKFLSLFLAVFDKVYVVSENVRNSFHHRISTNVKIIENVVDSEVFDFLSSYDESLLFVGRLESIKRVDFILRAFALSNLNKFKLNIIGDGSKRQSLEDLAAALNISDRVVFHGALPKNEIAEQMKKSAALLLFSETENKPCVICEAHSVGLPVFSNSVGGVPEMTDPSNAILVENCSISDYANKLGLLESRSFDRGFIRQKALERYSYKAFRDEVMYDSN